MAQFHSGRRMNLGGSIPQLPGTGYVLENKSQVPIGVPRDTGAPGDFSVLRSLVWGKRMWHKILVLEVVKRF